MGISRWYLLSRPLTSCLDAIAAFDDICFEADGSRSAVQLQEEPAGIAENRTRLIATPKWSRACGTILANGLQLSDAFD